MARSCREASRMFRLALASRCGETTAARIFGPKNVRGSLASSSSSSSHHRWYAAPSTKMMAQSHEDDDEWETVVGLELHVQLAMDQRHIIWNAEQLNECLAQNSGLRRQAADIRAAIKDRPTELMTVPTALVGSRPAQVASLP